MKSLQRISPTPRVRAIDHSMLVFRKMTWPHSNPESDPVHHCYIRSYPEYLQAAFSIRTLKTQHTLAFKKRPNFLNSSPTSIEGALRLLGARSGKFWQQTAICPVLLWALVVELHPLNWARAQAVRRINPTNSLCMCIHEDLDMRKLSAKWVPKFLNAEQKHQRCH
jgi:hypothetical protein